ncbi:hypothetical protein ABS71_10665 [bacterium SCN 62-11]|nr:hypothetical protein [Candidatus Eremiobacteraeota bacterium]ODT67553.1 MAG: hypothetical protein ABS71_10665 [bacterium SCN 62-11]
MSDPDQEYHMAVIREYADRDFERTLVNRASEDLEQFHMLCRLQPSDFRDEAARRGYLGLRQIFREGGTVSLMALQYLLQASEDRSDYKAAEDLISTYTAEKFNVVSNKEFMVLVRQVSKNALRRRMVEAGQRLVRLGNRDDMAANQLVDRATALITEASAGYVEKTLAHSERECWQMMADQLADREKAGPTALPRKLSLGFRGLDKLGVGIAPGMVISILGRSGMGKSIFGLQCARNLARQVPVLWFSFEMKWPELLARIVAQELDIPFDRATSTQLYSAGIKKAGNLYINDVGHSSVASVRRAIRQFKMQHPELAANLIIGLDYGQQLAKRVPDLQAEASAAIKTMAFEEAVGVLCVLQADPGIDQRKPELRVPISSDTRYSKAWEMDADTIISIFREAYYKDIRNADPGKALGSVCKQRDGGPTANFPLTFNGPLTKFSDPVYNPGMTPDMIEEMNRTPVPNMF